MTRSLTLLLLFLVPILPGSALQTVSGRVTRVVDGDTYRLVLDTGRRITVRLLGVDTPESYKTRYGYREYLGKAASRYVRRLMQGKRVRLHIQTGRRRRYGRGRYGRVLSYVEIGGRDLGALLLRTGYGKVYRKKPCSRHRLYLSMEREAKTRNVGIWNRARARAYYRSLFRQTRNDRLILHFWRHDRDFLRELLR